MIEEIEIVPEIHFYIRRPGEKKWSKFVEPDNNAFQRVLVECDIFCYKTFKRFINQPPDSRNEEEVSL